MTEEISMSKYLWVNIQKKFLREKKDFLIPIENKMNKMLG